MLAQSTFRNDRYLVIKKRFLSKHSRYIVTITFISFKVTLEKALNKKHGLLMIYSRLLRYDIQEKIIKHYLFNLSLKLIYKL